MPWRAQKLFDAGAPLDFIDEVINGNSSLAERRADVSPDAHSVAKSTRFARWKIHCSRAARERDSDPNSQSALRGLEKSGA